MPKDIESIDLARYDNCNFADVAEGKLHKGREIKKMSSNAIMLHRQAQRIHDAAIKTKETDIIHYTEKIMTHTEGFIDLLYGLQEDEPFSENTRVIGAIDHFALAHHRDEANRYLAHLKVAIERLLA